MVILLPVLLNGQWTLSIKTYFVILRPPGCGKVTISSNKSKSSKFEVVVDLGQGLASDKKDSSQCV